MKHLTERLLTSKSSCRPCDSGVLMLASGAKASAEELEEDPQDDQGLDGEDGGGRSVFRTYPASDTILLPDGNSSRVSSVPLTITVLYRLWFLKSERGFRRATRRPFLWRRRLLSGNELPRRVLLGNSRLPAYGLYHRSLSFGSLRSSAGYDNGDDY